MGLPPLDDQHGRPIAFAGDSVESSGLLPSEPSRSAELPSRRASMRNANDSCYATIAYSPLFVNATLTVIVFNAIWICVDTQWNHEELRKDGKLPLQPLSDVIEHLFCLFFTIELSIRFLAFKKKLLCIFDAWFVFDSFLVLFMVIETWIMGEIVYVIAGGNDGGGGAMASFSAFRLLRLLRLTRMVRIMRAVPELLTLVKGIGKATKAVSFILGFLILIIYVFAIVFTAQLGEWYAPEHKEVPWYLAEDGEGRDPYAVDLFGTIGDSMMTLFTQGVLGDNLAQVLTAIKDGGGKCPEDLNGSDPGSPTYVPPTMEQCEPYRDGGSIWLFWLFIVFFVITALTLLNMLIGVLCEVITESARQENETTQIKELDCHMRQAFAMIDSSEPDGLITRAEWSKMKAHKIFKASMVSLGVEEEHMDERLEQMQESLFGDLDRDPLGGPDEVVPMGAAAAGSRVGLSLDKFIEKVAEIRADTPASALDIEMLRCKVMAEEKMFNEKLDVIEAALAKLLVTAPVAAANKIDAGVKKPGRSPRDGADQKGDTWLQEIPTEILFSALKGRSPPELGQPKVLTDHAGAKSSFNQ